ncbi:MAG: hypothetical protein ISS87_00610 [Candidatus Pacebacteria bacterium]|nr:hypothetical protein [Candidatus Paceibacterota bacterium]
MTEQEQNISEESDQNENEGKDEKKPDSRKKRILKKVAKRIQKRAEEKTRKRGANAFLSPEGFLMMSIAIMLDLAGLALFILSFFGIGIAVSWILDLIGLIFIGGWMFMRSGKAKATKKAAKIGKKAFKKLGIGFIGEIIPFFGDIAFCWTIIVFLELRK